MAATNALVQKWRDALSANTDALNALFDKPPQGLTEAELDRLKIDRARAVTTAARQLESVVVTGKQLTLRRGD